MHFGPFQDKIGDRVIHYAAFGNQPHVVHELCTVFEADINSRNKRGQTPLHIAVNCGYSDVCHMLLRLNCLPNLQVSNCFINFNVLNKKNHINYHIY